MLPAESLKRAIQVCPWARIEAAAGTQPAASAEQNGRVATHSAGCDGCVSSHVLSARPAVRGRAPRQQIGTMDVDDAIGRDGSLPWPPRSRTYFADHMLSSV